MTVDTMHYTAQLMWVFGNNNNNNNNNNNKNNKGNMTWALSAVFNVPGIIIIII